MRGALIQKTIRPRGLSGWFDDYITPLFSKVTSKEEEAVAYIKSKVGEFLGLPLRFKRAFERLARLREAAATKNDQASLLKVNVLTMGVTKLKEAYAPLERRVTSLIETLKQYGFGLLPLVVVGVAIAVAGAVAFQLTSIKKLELQIDAAEKGLKLPSTFSFFGGGDMMSYLPLMAVGGLGLWFLTRKK
jgi:hypothetical protein